MNNLYLASGVLNKLFAQGVKEVVLCPGARNAPFVSLLSNPSSFKVYSFFEERDAAFFALGRIQDLGQSVAVITTSGTAVANLLPATIEADYQRLPLVLVTADRPVSYRGRGAPQSIIQPGIFSHYVAQSFDLSVNSADIKALNVLDRPIHINVCFDEPLLPKTVDSGTLANFPASKQEIDSKIKASRVDKHIKFKGQKPLIILGGLTHHLNVEFKERLMAKLLKFNRPVLIEAHSQLRGAPLLRELELKGSDYALPLIDFDSVIRIGSVPTIRLWRDLEKQKLEVLNFSSTAFSGLSYVDEVLALEDVFNLEAQFSPWSAKEKESCKALEVKLEDLLKKYPLSEPGLIQALSAALKDNTRVFLGNSLPIREWDLAASRNRPFEVLANRGVNGIDGLVSTFLGAAKRDGPNLLVLGDLSALYNLSGLWPYKQRPSYMTLAVINNSGGKIFHRLFHNPLFENQHDLNFENWAKMWNFTYRKIEHPKDLLIQAEKEILEIVPDLKQSELFWSELESSR